MARAFGADEDCPYRDLVESPALRHAVRIVRLSGMTSIWHTSAAALLAALLASCSDDAAHPPDAVPEPDASPPDAELPPCEPVDGTGCPPGQKCTLVPTGVSNPAYRVGCDDLHGTLGAFAPDCRQPPDNFDQCGPGLFCFAGREPDGRYCRPLCHADSDCPSEIDRCLWFVAGPPPTGFCAYECSLFGADCPLESNCSNINLDADMTTFWMGCKTPGNIAVGEACLDVYSCAADAYCWDRTCRALCDSTHACAAGACEPIPGLPAGGGVCR